MVLKNEQYDYRLEYLNSAKNVNFAYLNIYISGLIESSNFKSYISNLLAK
jgi:hypothetical protein